MGILIRRVVIPLVVLAALFFGLNVLARNVAADRIAQAAQSSFGLKEKPAVSLDGFPILVRALTGSLPGLSFEAVDVEVEGLLFEQVVVRMRDIEADGGLLRSGGLRVVIGRGEVRAVATDEAVNALLEQREQNATIAFAPNGRATVEATRRVGGRRRTIVASGTVSLDEAKQILRFEPDEVTVDGREPSGAMQREAKRRSTITLELPRLPGDLRVRVLQTAEGSVALAAVLEDFAFPPEPGEDLEDEAA